MIGNMQSKRCSALQMRQSNLTRNLNHDRLFLASEVVASKETSNGIDPSYCRFGPAVRRWWILGTSSGALVRLSRSPWRNHCRTFQKNRSAFAPGAEAPGPPINIHGWQAVDSGSRPAPSGLPIAATLAHSLSMSTKSRESIYGIGPAFGRARRGTAKGGRPSGLHRLLPLPRGLLSWLRHLSDLGAQHRPSAEGDAHPRT
jgi:hypothetical protein